MPPTKTAPQQQKAEVTTTAGRPLESRQSNRSGKSVTISENEKLHGLGEEEQQQQQEEETTYDIFMRLRENCINFVFPPPQKVVPKALARMTSYARYGPAVMSKSIDGKDRLRLRGAQKGTGVLREHEETILIKEEEGAVVADIYTTATPSTANAASLRPPKTTAASTIDGTTFGEMNAKKHPLIHHLMEVSLEELTQVLDETVLPEKEKDGGKLKETTIADAISNALLGERQRRINVVKTSSPDLKKLRTDLEVTNRAATRFYNKTAPKAYEVRSWEDPKDVLRALHRSVWQISDPGVKKSGDLSLNVRCLRPTYEMPMGSVKEGWDSYCCTRKTADSRATTLRK